MPRCRGIAALALLALVVVACGPPPAPDATHVSPPTASIAPRAAPSSTIGEHVAAPESPATTPAGVAHTPDARTATTAGSVLPEPTTALSAAALPPCSDPAFRQKGAAMAFIVASQPVAGASVRSGFAVSGCANVFEAALQWRLTTVDGTVLAQGFAQATCGTGCVGDFAFAVDFATPDHVPQAGTLEVFSVSMRDGTEENLNAIPLVIE